MARKRTKVAVTDEEILAYDNVPYDIAAAYIGWSDVSIRNALKQGRAPFGCAAQNPETKTWSYNISPGLLVNYKRGTLPAWRLNDVINMAADGIQQLLDTRLAAMALTGYEVRVSPCSKRPA